MLKISFSLPSCIILLYTGADLVNWGPQANIRMGPYTFAHIFFVMMLAAAQWWPIVESKVSTFFMYMLEWDSLIYIYIYSYSRHVYYFML